jgi:hypothetical protein
MAQSTHHTSAFAAMVLAPLVYFDMFGYPLTADEVYSFLYRPSELGVDFGDEVPTRAQIDQILADLHQQGFLTQRNGLYFLAEQTVDLVLQRQQRYRISIEKFRQSRWRLRVLRCFPFIRAILVCNSMPLHNAQPAGDIDLVFVTVPGRLYTTRFWLVTFLKLMRWRPTPTKKKNQLCPSFFIDETALNIKQFQKGADHYLRFWATTVMPVIESAAFADLWQAENQWLDEFFPHYLPTRVAPRIQIQATWLSQSLQRWAENIVAAIPERLYYRLQLRLFPAAIRQKMNDSTDVVIQPNVAKLHQGDRRAEVATTFEQKFQTLWNNYLKK